EQLLLAFLIRPILKQPAGRGGHACITALPPERDALPDSVYKLILFNPVLSPFCIEDKLLPLLLRLRNRHKVGADSAARLHLVCDSRFGEFEMAVRLLKRRV